MMAALYLRNDGCRSESLPVTGNERAPARGREGAAMSSSLSPTAGPVDLANHASCVVSSKRGGGPAKTA